MKKQQHIKEFIFYTLFVLLLASPVFSQEIIKQMPSGFDSIQPTIPHGKIDTVTYNSKTAGNNRRALIYTPAGFRAAIGEKYPQLTCISTIADAQYPKIKVTSGKPPVVLDEHYYRDSWDMWENASQYDKYDRKGPKIFVGEWATREGAPATNLNAALGDAAWMTGMERNSDLIIMSCYAPLFVNVSKDSVGGKKAWQWDSDLIGYDALNSYGSPSYYVQKLFSHYLGNKIVPVTATNIPVQNKPLSKSDSAEGKKITTVPTIFIQPQ